MPGRPWPDLSQLGESSWSWFSLERVLMSAWAFYSMQLCDLWVLPKLRFKGTRATW